MNERIEKLAEQANIRFGRMAILDGDPRGMARYVTYSEFEKFAELIVRECAAMTRNLSAHGELAEKAVKEHFGVE